MSQKYHLLIINLIFFQQMCNTYLIVCQCIPCKETIVQVNVCQKSHICKISKCCRKIGLENWVALSKKTVPGLVLRNPHGIFYNPQVLGHGLSRGCMLTRRKIKGPDKTSWFASQRYYCLARSSHTPLASLHVIKHNVTFARQVCKNETHFLRKRSEFN